MTLDNNIRTYIHVYKTLHLIVKNKGINMASVLFKFTSATKQMCIVWLMITSPYARNVGCFNCFMCVDADIEHLTWGDVSTLMYQYLFVYSV